VTGRRSLARAAGAIVGVLLLAGCGDQPGYDHAAVESYLAKSQVDTFGASGKVGDAACPRGLELREGMTFTCKLDVSGARLPYRVRLTHVHEARVSISASPAGVVLSASRIGDFVGSTLPKTSSGAKVDCGGAFVVAKVGDTIACTLTLGSQEQPLKVTVKDDSGQLQIGS
jgi:hypothetical protein